MEESTSLHVCQYLAAVSLSEMTVIFPIQTRNQRAVLAVAFTFSILAVVAVSLRLLAHHIAHKPWTASDYFLIAACVRQALAMGSTNNLSIGLSSSRSVSSPSVSLAYSRLVSASTI